MTEREFFKLFGGEILLPAENFGKNGQPWTVLSADVAPTNALKPRKFPNIRVVIDPQTCRQLTQSRATVGAATELNAVTGATSANASTPRTAKDFKNSFDDLNKHVDVPSRHYPIDEIKQSTYYKELWR